MKEIDLWKVRGFTGKLSVDPREVSEYLLSLGDIRMADDPSETRYEDIEIPSHEPFVNCIEFLVKEALNTISK